MIRRRQLALSTVSVVAIGLTYLKRSEAQMIEPVSVTEQMMYSTVRLIGLDAAGKEIQTGTGFSTTSRALRRESTYRFS